MHLVRFPFLSFDSELGTFITEEINFASYNIDVHVRYAFLRKVLSKLLVRQLAQQFPLVCAAVFVSLTTREAVRKNICRI